MGTVVCGSERGTRGNRNSDLQRHKNDYGRHGAPAGHCNNVGSSKIKNKKLGSAEQKTPEEKKKDRKSLIVGGLVCGTVLCVSSNLQQAAFGYTTVGKVGFITALYMLLVPIISLVFFKSASVFLCG